MRFDELQLSEGTMKGITQILGYETMSDVQSKAITKVLHTSNDVLVQSKTGTGKTLCYLIPVIEKMVRSPPVAVGALILAPTRELVLQIVKEASQLLTHHPAIDILPLTGGTSRRQDTVALKRRRPQIVVATPGRLLDHLSSTFNFHSLFTGLSVMVLDEADRLLELGSIDDLRTIMTYMPKDKQSLLFSATITDDVREIATRACRANYMLIDCIPHDDIPTVDRVQQRYVTLPARCLTQVLYHCLMNEMRTNLYSYKILVFFPTARCTAFFAHFYREQLRIAVYEMHRRRDQHTRSVTSDRFKSDPTGIMFSSDLSARGMDYPNVTLVIQVCAPPSREQYIHRIGRTARVHSDGRGLLLLTENEAQGGMEAIKDLPIHKIDDKSLFYQNDLLVNAVSSWMANTQLLFAASAAYASLLTYFKVHARRLKLSDSDIIQTAGDMLLSAGLVDTPAISRRLAQTLQLEGNPMIKVQDNLDELDALEYLHETADHNRQKQHEERRYVEELKLTAMGRKHDDRDHTFTQVPMFVCTCQLSVWMFVRVGLGCRRMADIIDVACMGGL